jgi:hypothetical protein
LIFSSPQAQVTEPKAQTLLLLVPEPALAAEPPVAVVVLLLSSILNRLAVVAAAAQAVERLPAASLPAVSRCLLCLVRLDQSCVAVQP